MDVLGRIKELMEERGWSAYRLSKESGVPQSTVSHIFCNEAEPTISTLEVLCTSLDVSLGEFFSEGEAIPLTAEQRALLSMYGQLKTEHKELVVNLIKSLL